MRTIQIKIEYYNVTFTVFLRTEIEHMKFAYFARTLRAGGMYMRDFREWCNLQDITFTSKFNYKREYPLLANIWNLVTYTRFRLEGLWQQMKASQRWKQENC